MPPVLEGAAQQRQCFLFLRSSQTQQVKKKKAKKPNKSLSIMSANAKSSPNHIIIVGGGVIGASTAYFLSIKLASSAAPTKITLIEKSSIAAAASGKSGGFLALDWCDSSSLSYLARASFDLHRELSQTLDGERNYGYRPLTTLSFRLMGSKGNCSGRSKFSAPGWIDESSVGNLKTIGTTETTAQVHPKLFTQTLIDASTKTNKLNVIIGEVKEVVAEGGKITGVVVREKGHEDNKVLKCDIVVFAVGPWSSSMWILSEIFRISGTKVHSIVVRPKETEAITPHALSLSYQDSPGGKMLDPEVYPRPSGEVYICGMSEEVQVPENPEEIIGDPTSIEMLHKIAGKVSSHLQKDEGAEVIAEQACFLPCSADGLPVIGELPGVKGCYVATGHSCWGILNAPATGASLAELILDGESTTVDLTPFSPFRFLKRPARK